MFEDEYEECDCGNKKRIIDNFCNKCQKEITDKFKDLMYKNFDKKELEYLQEVICDEDLVEYVIGKEELEKREQETREWLKWWSSIGKEV